MGELDAHGLRLGECAAVTLAALRALATDAAELRTALALEPATRVLLVASDGRTGKASDGAKRPIAADTQRGSYSA